VKVSEDAGCPATQGGTLDAFRHDRIFATPGDRLQTASERQCFRNARIEVTSAMNRLPGPQVMHNERQVILWPT
jgi:hypothetical protein